MRHGGKRPHATILGGYRMTVSIHSSRTSTRLARQAWRWPVIRGLLAVVLGIITLAWPAITVVAIVVTVGAFVVADGILEIVEGIRHRTAPGTGLHVVLGLLGLAVGLLLLLWPQKSAEVVVWFIGLWAVLAGLLQCAAASARRPIPGSGWGRGWGLFVGILGVVLGVLVILNVSAGLASIVWLIASWAILRGVLLIAAGFMARRAERNGGIARQRD